MGIPQVPEQLRRAPLLAVRAVFAGIGRAVMVADRQAPVIACRADTAAMTPAVAGAERAVGLPLQNYDALSLASIRARLRGLDVAQLKVLLDYEAVTAERPELLGMFERRIDKLQAGS